ncbi:hypothetical protein L7F22_002441 [Adiantum nelumboides]|nr:hypothetical protein [Adiantum nelumboides]
MVLNPNILDVEADVLFLYSLIRYMCNFASRDIKVFNVENSNETPLGVVCVKGELTYGIVRKEIIEDELFEEPFHFVLEDFVAINAKQEEKWLVENGPVYLKRKASDESLNLNTSKVPCNDSRSSLRSDHRSTVNDEMVSSQSATLEKAILVSNKDLHNWEKEYKRVRSKLKNMTIARDDNFELRIELRIEELNGKGVIQLRCNKCGEAYGTGPLDGKLAAYTCLANFLQTHIFSKRHEKMYHYKRGLSKIASKREATKEDDASCIRHALEVMDSFKYTKNGVSFELVEGTLHGSKDKKLVRIQCTYDNTWLPLCPPQSNLQTIMLEHTLSKTHTMEFKKTMVL